jgi:hypothetical protein
MAMAMATAGGEFGGGWEPPVNNGGVFPLQDLIAWNTCPHDGHRLWAQMSDAFWVYVYKVHRCPNRYAHDWALCPYAHVGERARRRDPRGYTYLAVACPDYRASYQHNLDTGSRASPTCARGLGCRFAHGVFELWLHPELFRTRMCDAGVSCPRKICFFAHYAAQLRREIAVVEVPALPPPYAQHITAPPPPVRRPPSRVVVAPVSTLPRPNMVLQTRSGAKIPLNNGGGDEGASSSSSTPALVVATPANGPISIGSSSRPADYEDPDEAAHFDLIVSMLEGLMMD